MLYNYFEESQVSDHCFLEFLENWECFYFNHALWSLQYLIQHNWTSSLSFQLAGYLFVFIFAPGFNGGNALGGKADVNGKDVKKKK